MQDLLHPQTLIISLTSGSEIQQRVWHVRTIRSERQILLDIKDLSLDAFDDPEIGLSDR